MSPLPSSRVTTAFPGSIAVSVLLHGAVLVVLAQLSAPALPPLATIIPVSLVSLPGGGGGPKGEDVGPEPGPPVVASAPVAPAPVAPPAKVAKPPKAVARVTKPAAPTPSPAAEPPPTLADTSSGSGSPGVVGVGALGGGGGGGSGAGGGGDGNGGDGSGGARVAGQNPLPPYPMVARRLRMEGTVLLDFLVTLDGRATDVRVARSSGHQQLDDSAVSTVRERWRFIPARRNGAAVESRGTYLFHFKVSGVEAAG